MKILVLKAPKETSDDVDPYVDALRNAGMSAESLDVLSFQFTNQDMLQEKISHPEVYGGFVFTSPRGVMAVELSCKRSEFNTAAWSALPCYVVGEGTAKVLKEKFGMASRGQESGSAQQLAQIICKERGGSSMKPLLFPSAEMKRNLLVESLTNFGIPIDVVTSYKTIPHPQLEHLLQQRLSKEGCEPDTLIFFSPSGVNAVLSVLSNVNHNYQCFRMVAIGPTTKAALEDRGQIVFATASQPSPSSLVEALSVALSASA